MDLTISSILLAAKQHEIAELERLAGKAELVGVIGHLIHALQGERGASSIYLASAGRRFADTRHRLIEESLVIEQTLNQAFKQQLAGASFEEARQFYLMAWVLLGLDSLPLLRQQISSQAISSARAVAAFSRFIAGLISLLFEVAHNVPDARISRALVALFNFIQGKEHTGQERAVGGLSFASGSNDDRHQQQIVHLVDAQDRCFQIFDEFASKAARDYLLENRALAVELKHEALRQTLLSTAADGKLDPNQAGAWFDCCTVRLNRMWTVQQFLVGELQELCAERITAAEAELQDTEGLAQGLAERAPASTSLVDRFFDPDMHIDVALKIMPGKNGAAMGDSSLGDSIVEVLLAQSERLASMENELEQARRSLNERKLIEKAKGLLMAKRGLSEDAAYKVLRQNAMEQNKRIVELAEAMLNFHDWIGGLDGGDGKRNPRL